MIGLMISAAIVGQEPSMPVIVATPADFPDYAASTLWDCLRDHPASGPQPQHHGSSSMQGVAGDGTTIVAQQRNGNCYITTPQWRPQGERLAARIWLSLDRTSSGFAATRWRELVVNERGPSVWTTFDRPAQSGPALHVRIIEPADGAVGEAIISLEVLTP